uniref:clp protease proteolytic subunit n=1 Tax=Gueldenstaedtia verna TaxID=714474 RepID=UPI002E776FBD|nr:clp protease proteolytic subunit [Gueldenstaedtia verna]WRI15680.1 clp protease proteolytic subunit [Gueldenstaedtia verna]
MLMPQGVPKVPFLMPEDEDEEDDDLLWSWEELYHALYFSRFLFLFQEIKAEIANQICGLILCLGILNNKDIFMFIHTPGGEIRPGLGIYNSIQLGLADVHTINIGLAASMGSLVLVGGEMSKRMASPHSRIMIHQPKSSESGDDDTKSFSCLHEYLLFESAYETMIEIYKTRTKLPEEEIVRDLDRDRYISAEEALAYGFVDAITEEGGFPQRN